MTAVSAIGTEAETIHTCSWSTGQGTSQHRASQTTTDDGTETTANLKTKDTATSNGSEAAGDCH